MMRCLHAAPCLDGNRQCFLICHPGSRTADGHVGSFREQMIRKVCIEAITQATAVAKANRALRTKTTITGQHYYDEGY
eukprot:6917307-Pyramimonas_sp.AAC.1